MSTPKKTHLFVPNLVIKTRRASDILVLSFLPPPTKKNCVIDIHLQNSNEDAEVPDTVVDSAQAKADDEQLVDEELENMLSQMEEGKGNASGANSMKRGSTSRMKDQGKNSRTYTKWHLSFLHETHSEIQFNFSERGL